MSQAMHARKVFYGSDLKIGETVIFTPIPAFYRALLAGAASVSETKGWWRIASIRHSGEPWTVIQHPESARVTDAVLSVAGTARSAFFLGLCGSIDGKFEIGKLAVATRGSRNAINPIPARIPAGMREMREVEFAEVSTVDGFLSEDDELLNRHRESEVHLLDLETYYFYKTAGPLFESFAAILAVCDQPPQRPFWDVPLSDDDMQATGETMKFILLNSCCRKCAV